MINKIKHIIVLCVFVFAQVPLVASADILAEAAARGTLHVGVSMFAPWTIKGENSELQGFEIDVARKLAADMGVTAEFKVYEWDEIISGLERGEIDVIAAGMAITPKRAMRISFSVPYDEWGATLVTNSAKTRNVESLSALNQSSTIMATVSETFAHEVSGHLFDKVDLRVFKTVAEAEKAVLDGTVHAYLVSGPEAYFFTLENPDVVDMPLAEPLASSRAAFAVPRGEQEWLNFLNAWVNAREADGWIKTAHHYWFRTIAWRNKETAK